jgi:hypothetical protein
MTDFMWSRTLRAYAGLTAALLVLTSRAGDPEGERGEVAPWTIITGVMSAAAVVIAGVIVQRATGWANSIPSP